MFSKQVVFKTPSEAEDLSIFSWLSFSIWRQQSVALRCHEAELIFLPPLKGNLLGKYTSKLIGRSTQNE